MASGSVLGHFNFSEERTDLLTIWIARKYAGWAEDTYLLLQADAETLRAAVIRDGASVSGEYMVPNDGFDLTIQREPGQSFAVLQLVLPVNYEYTLEE